jgi:hypothetical protein
VIRSHQDPRHSILLATLLPALALATACAEGEGGSSSVADPIVTEQRAENPYLDAGRRELVELQRGVQAIRRLEGKEAAAGRVEAPACAPRLEQLLSACVSKLAALDRASPAEWECASHELQISLRRLDTAIVEAKKKHFNEH